jgi:selenium-binding protein 1
LKSVATVSASYFSNSLYSAWDEQFYPAGVGSWMVKLDAPPEGGIEFDNKFFMQPDDYRIHQIRLEGATRPPTRSAIRE